MSHIRIDSSVPRHRKFVQAGPAPAWLWVCGLTYCQEGLTDGFIPVEAIDYLGVQNARRLAVHLVKARLWEETDGGWMVHDYLKHNKSAATIRSLQSDKRRAAARGGEASGRSRASKQSASPETKQSAEPLREPICTGDVEPAVPVVALKEESPRETKPLDVEYARFKATYPEARRGSGHAERLYFQAVEDGLTTPGEMMLALQNHVESEQWQDVRHIPNISKWLEDRRWETRLPPRKSFGTTSKTAGNADAVRQFLENHRAAR